MFSLLSLVLFQSIRPSSEPPAVFLPYLPSYNISSVPSNPPAPLAAMVQHLLFISAWIPPEKYAPFPSTKPFNWIIDACAHNFFIITNHHWWDEMCFRWQHWHRKFSDPTSVSRCLLSAASQTHSCVCNPITASHILLMGQPACLAFTWVLSHLEFLFSSPFPNQFSFINSLHSPEPNPWFLRKAISRDGLWSQIDLCLDFIPICC